MPAFYNEIEPFAVEWLRNLGSADHVAPGVVDGRSIADLSPGDLAGYQQCHFFAGIGVWSAALRGAGWPDAVEVWTGSCPCQPFSGAGRRGGFEDERHLWPTWFGLVGERLPPVVLGEQVASPDGLAWLDVVLADLEGAGYACAAFDLCAAGVGAPHLRQRLWFAAVYVGDDPVARARVDAVVERLRAERARDVADDHHDRREGSESHLPERKPRGDMSDAGRPGATGRVAVGDAGLDGDRQHAGELRGDEGAIGADRADAPEHAGAARDRAGELGDADRERLEKRAGERRDDVAQLAPAERAGGSAGDRAGERRDVANDPSGRRREGNSLRSGSGNGTSSADGRVGSAHDRRAGHWSDCDWVPCTDGKSRPVEPGTFPLAHGAVARVGRLRAYGNAIVRPLAQEFVASLIDVLVAD